jgi:hypothetical protein
MALKAIIKTLMDVSEELRSEYRALPNDGGFVVDVIETNGFAVENIEGLRNTLQTQKTSLQSVKDQLALFGDANAGTIKADLAELAKLRKLDPAELTKPAVQAAIDAEKLKYEGVIGDLNTTNTEQSGVISGLMVNTVAIEALATAGGSATLLLPHVKSQCKVLRQDDGERIVQVLDHNGNPRIAIEDGKTRDFTIKDLVTEMRADDTYAMAFGLKGKAGHGGPGDHDAGIRDNARVIHDVGHESMSNNLEDIASGKVVVEMDN